MVVVKIIVKSLPEEILFQLSDLGLTKCIVKISLNSGGGASLPHSLDILLHIFPTLGLDLGLSRFFVLTLQE